MQLWPDTALWPTTVTSVELAAIAASSPPFSVLAGLKAHGRLSPDPVPAEAGHVAPDQHQLTASGRRKRKDTGARGGRAGLG